jgi:RNA polymerase sigma-70 factor (ECF subfamily)
VKKKNGFAIASDEFEKDCLHGMISAETVRLLYEAINELPAQCKKVFTKLYVEGKSVAEIATEMNVAVSTVKNQKARGIKLLKPKLSPPRFEKS